MNKKLKSKKVNTNAGITLIALILTIIVLLILAVVAIQAVQGDGILAHAKNARAEYQNAQNNEAATLQNYTDYIAQQSGNNPDGEGTGGQTSSPSDPAKTMTEAQSEDMFAKTVNSPIEDEYGNKVVVPAGFKVLVDETTKYEHATNPLVTDGIVIQDSQGNEFVWVPIGEIYTSKEHTTEENKKITFGRYSWDKDTGVGTEIQSATKGGGFNNELAIQVGSESYTEKLSESVNAKAKDIVEFCDSVSSNRGYYIGRYEVGELNGVLVCKKGQTPHYRSTQPNAAARCQAMYSEKPFTSDLVNSYAWDTAIIFIQQCGTEEKARTYAKECMSSTIRTNRRKW